MGSFSTTSSGWRAGRGGRGGGSAFSFGGGVGLGVQRTTGPATATHGRSNSATSGGP